MNSPGNTIPPFSPYNLNRSSAFACIAMLESGTFDINPAELHTVMAMSYGDSIYAAMPLLCDPSEQSLSGAISRVRGNIGQPGVSFLVPPSDPLIKKPLISEWPQISRDDFDGIVKDCFQSTSLQLSLTGAQSQLNLGFSGAQDEEVHIMETLISIHENGRWIADLDPLRTFNSVHLVMVGSLDDQKNHSCNQGLKIPGLCLGEQMISINNWLELIDPPESMCSIVQAHGNWEARLAAASISVAKGNHTFVMPPKTCFRCLEHAVSRGTMYGKHRIIAIA